MEPFKELPAYLEGRQVGETRLYAEGARVTARTTIYFKADGRIFRALLGEVNGGIFIDDGDVMRASRSLSAEEAARAGDRCLVTQVAQSAQGRAAPAQGSQWEKNENPAALLPAGGLRSDVARAGWLYTKKDGSGTLLAYPLEEGRPFPFVSAWRRVFPVEIEGKRCGAVRLEEL